MPPAIAVEGVTKVFRIAHDKPTSAKERLIRLGRIAYEDFRALDDVSFTVAPGETVAVLGHNGSGKSTLLKCVTRTLRPTAGTITTRGRLAALLELGAGFHPDLTGRENVYLNGSILGFSKAQVDRIFDEIVAFAELEDFIDLQVKHYSSGMYARLGFAVAINVDPDVLLVDEVLSVGDEAFQRKCIDRIRRLQQEGRTILLVSHAADLVRQIADRAVVIDHGRLIAEGAPGEAIRAFRDALAGRGLPLPAEAGEPGPEAAPALPLVPDAGARVTIGHVRVDHPNGEGGDHLHPGAPFALRVGYAATGLITDVAISLEIIDQAGALVMGTSTDALEQPLHAVNGEGEVVFHVDHLPLVDGRFGITVSLHSHHGGTVYDERHVEDAFSVVNPTRSRGTVHFPVKVEHLYHF